MTQGGDLHGNVGDPRPRPRVVMKFGGSSVADHARLREVAAKIVARAATADTVVVVSAMGKTTDALVAQARALSPRPAPRELDMLLTTGERHSMALLAIAVTQAGRPAVSLTGSQCGILTDHRHGEARVVEVRPFRIEDELAEGRIVIVGGFQGVSYRREVTTLGRGGSDTSAVALAAALGADCEIYSDVDGVYSSDPRDVPHAQRFDALDYDTVISLARAGARVLHARALELAKERGVAIHARATAGGGETVVRRLDPPPPVRAVARDAHVSRLCARGPQGPQGAALAGALARMAPSELRVETDRIEAWWSHTQRDDGDAIWALVDEGLAGGGRWSDWRLEPMPRGQERVCCVGPGAHIDPRVLAFLEGEACARAATAQTLTRDEAALFCAQGSGPSIAQALHDAVVGPPA